MNTMAYTESKKMKEALKQILDLLQPVAALADGTPFEHSEVIQRCVDASEIALEALAQPAQEPTGMLHIDRLDKWLDASLKERKAQPAQQCLDCGSNNIGVPATYDSLIDSVKTPQENA